MTAKGVLYSTGALLPLVIVFLALTSPLAKGATAGELLEKAIYAEETTGDLDEAIKLYEQVIAEAKTAKSAVAKAKYRLGLIYEKQGKAVAAATARRNSLYLPYQLHRQSYDGQMASNADVGA